ncbi:MAG: hypothetical protein U5K73_10815 [Halofilum sp. (in: g-proteobacteria)]|nr:hypothetical protein [Halofilum sp. (in: g-proteobacteria)]
MDGTHGPRILDGGGRPAPRHVKLARGVLVVTLVQLLLISGMAMYAYGEFLPGEQLYGLAHQIAALTCAILIVAPIWIAWSGHLRKEAFQRPVQYVALWIVMVALLGGLSWKSTVVGVGWFLHQTAPATMETHTYTVERRLFGSGNRSVICDEGVRVRERRWPFDALCGLSYRDSRDVRPGDQLVVRGTASEYGFLMHSYTIDGVDD